jgi:nucleoside-diphosphate-sugar epimerase
MRGKKVKGGKNRSADRKHERALVTGGGGFLGYAIVEQLVERGDKVQSYSRGDYPQLKKIGVKQIRGDLTDYKKVRDACKGMDIVYHVAAKPGVWGPYDEYYKPNVIGTKNVIKACEECQVGRLVYSSSASVVFGGGSIEGGDESLPYPKKPKSNYTATKAIAEKALLKADSRKLRTLSIRPHLIWGPRDNHLGPGLIDAAESGRFKQVGDGKNKVDTTYITNCADAHLLGAEALETNPNSTGRAYFISNDKPVGVWDWINKLLKAADAPQIKGQVGAGTAMAAATVMEFFYKVLPLKGEPKLNRFLVGELTTSHWFDISAAKKELGYRPKVGMDKGFKLFRKWYKAQKRD